MEIVANLTVSGAIHLIDDSEDSILMRADFANEGNMIGDAGKMRIAQALKMALWHELHHSGVGQPLASTPAV